MVDDLMDALIGKLEGVSSVWGDTFAAGPEIDPKRYARLKKIENTYGYDTVRRVFEYAYEKRLSPQGSTAMPLATALCKTVGKG